MSDYSCMKDIEVYLNRNQFSKLFDISTPDEVVGVLKGRLNFEDLYEELSHISNHLKPVGKGGFTLWDHVRSCVKGFGHPTDYRESLAIMEGYFEQRYWTLDSFLVALSEHTDLIKSYE